MATVTEPEFYTVDDLPPVNVRNRAQEAYDRIMARHALAAVRQTAPMPQC